MRYDVDIAVSEEFFETFGIDEVGFMYDSAYDGQSDKYNDGDYIVHHYMTEDEYARKHTDSD